jgi:hypothetical protein
MNWTRFYRSILFRSNPSDLCIKNGRETNARGRSNRPRFTASDGPEAMKDFKNDFSSGERLWEKRYSCGDQGLAANAV